MAKSMEEKKVKHLIEIIYSTSRPTSVHSFTGNLRHVKLNTDDFIRGTYLTKSTINLPFRSLVLVSDNRLTYLVQSLTKCYHS